MFKEKVLVTKEGLANLKSEYKELTQVDRKKIIEELKRTRELGDLSENGAYHAAREKQSFVEGRIKELEAILKCVEVVDNVTSSVVTLGSTVTLQRLSKGGSIDRSANSKLTYKIVGTGESDFLNNKVAHDSPLGKAIVGKKKGDKAVVEAPSGIIEYTIVSLE